VIDLYTWTTPNAARLPSCWRKSACLPVHAIDISKDEQFAPAFLKSRPITASPRCRYRHRNVTDGVGAILIYLADKTGSCCRNPQGALSGDRVLTWQMADRGRCSPGPSLREI